MEQKQKLVLTVIAISILILSVLAASLFLFFPAEKSTGGNQTHIEWAKNEIPQQKTDTKKPVINEEKIIISDKSTATENSQAALANDSVKIEKVAETADSSETPKPAETAQPQHSDSLETTTQSVSKSNNTSSNTQNVAKTTAETKNENSSKEIKQPAESDKKNQIKSAETKISAPTVEYWIQIGTFASRDNADKAIVTMRNNGYKAIKIQGTSNGKTVYRVRAGEYSDIGKADKALKGIKKIYGFSESFIIKTTK